MNEKLNEKDLERVDFGYDYFQLSGGIYHTNKHTRIGEFYIHQIIIKRDIKNGL